LVSDILPGDGKIGNLFYSVVFSLIRDTKNSTTNKLRFNVLKIWFVASYIGQDIT
jgi:hypothetical protein